MKKKLLSVLVSVALLCSYLLPMQSWAADGKPPTDGADLFTGTAWTAKEKGDALQLDLGGEITINRIHLNEETYGAVQFFHLEVWDGNSWEFVYDNDYILTDRTCILPEDVTTSAVRLVVDVLAGEAVITDFWADYQGNSRNSAFMNVGYVSYKDYELLTELHSFTEEQYHSMTDLIMTGNFNFDAAGTFLISRHDINNGNITESYRFDTQEAAERMKVWTNRLKGASGNLTDSTTRFWFSLTALDKDSSNSAAWLDEAARKSFAEDVVQFALDNGMYGVELDWAPTTEDTVEAFRLAVAELAAKLRDAGLKFAVTLSLDAPGTLTAVEFDAIDYLNYKTYDEDERTDTIYAQVSYARLNDLVDEVIKRGCDPAKLWIGLPYGSKIERIDLGDYVLEFQNTYRFSVSICHGYITDKKIWKGYNIYGCDYFDDRYGLPSIPGLMEGLAYNGIYLIQDKVAYAVEQGCAGVMNQRPSFDIHAFRDDESDYPTLGADYVEPMCGDESLLRAVYETVRRFTGVDPLNDLPAADLTQFDGSAWTANKIGDTLQLDLGEDTLINRIHLNEETYGAVQTFHIEIWNGESWENIYDNDYILSGRTCILPGDVTTNAVRLVIDSLCEEAVITEFSADYQGNNKNAAFMNVGYISQQWYDRGWDDFSNTEAQLNSMTDLIMNGNFTFDENGKFLVTQQNGGPISYDPFSSDANLIMRLWLTKLKNASSNVKSGKTRLWFSITALTREVANSDTLLDEKIRRQFAKDVVAFAQKHGFYGVDVDWEYPDESESSLRAFRLTLATLSEELHAAGLKLSACICPPYREFLGAEEFEVLDYVSWMTYSNIENGNNVQAQVTFQKMKDLIEDTIARGCDPSKIWIGLPYFSNTSDWFSMTFANFSPVVAVNNTIPKGLNQFAGGNCYNGAYLLQDKVAYAADIGCAGMMSWWPGQDIKAFYDDDIYNAGGRAILTGKDSLIRAVYEAVRRFTGVDPLNSGLRGDVDLNGEVNPLDALLALRVSVGLEELTPEQFAVTDLDYDGEITPLDALSILRISVGLDE